MEKDKESWMLDALDAATSSPALRGKVGLVVVKNGELMFRICNQIPGKLGRDKCETDAPTIEEAHTLPEVLHAEEAAVSYAALLGVSLVGAEIYITRTPCKHCASHLIMADIGKLYYFSEHPHGDGLPLLEEAGIPYEKVNFEQDILPEKYL